LVFRIKAFDEPEVVSRRLMRIQHGGYVALQSHFALGPYPLPPTEMRAAVNVQHLAGDLARLGEIENGLRDVPGVRNLSKR
jgi:hypothetical protein